MGHTRVSFSSSVDLSSAFIINYKIENHLFIFLPHFPPLLFNTKEAFTQFNSLVLFNCQKLFVHLISNFIVAFRRTGGWKKFSTRNYSCWIFFCEVFIFSRSMFFKKK